MSTLGILAIGFVIGATVMLVYVFWRIKDMWR